MWPNNKQTKSDRQTKNGLFCANDCETLHITIIFEYYIVVWVKKLKVSIFVRYFLEFLTHEVRTKLMDLSYM